MKTLSDNDELDENIYVPITDEQRKSLDEIKARLLKKQQERKVQGKTTKEVYTVTVDDKDKVQGFEALKKMLEKKFEKLDADYDIDSIKTAEDLAIGISVAKDIERKQGRGKGERKGGSGTAPLSSATSPKDELEFESYEELLTYLRDIERQEGEGTRRGREAKKALDTIFLKTQKGLSKKGVRPQGWEIEVPSKEMREAYGTDSIIKIMQEQLREDFEKRRVSRKKRKKEIEEEI